MHYSAPELYRLRLGRHAGTMHYSRNLYYVKGGTGIELCCGKFANMYYLEEDEDQ
jgi:hypothetical protein